MPTISIEAVFDCGKLFTSREAETLEEALEKVNKDFPALSLTPANVVKWSFEQTELFK